MIPFPMKVKPQVIVTGSSPRVCNNIGKWSYQTESNLVWLCLSCLYLLATIESMDELLTSDIQINAIQWILVVALPLWLCLKMVQTFESLDQQLNWQFSWKLL